MPTKTPPNNNEQLTRALARVDVWRGFRLAEQAVPVTAESTGFGELDNHLRSGGWPSDGLVDIALQHYGSEWLLWLPWLQSQMQAGHTVALLSPPWLPYAASLVSAGVNLDQLLIVTPQNNAQWLASWRDIAKANLCVGVLAWAQTLSYPELRKCHLLASDSTGVFAVHRPWLSQRQSSPATLRLALSWRQSHLNCQLLKQKGCVAGQDIQLQPPSAIAALWQEFGPYQVSTKEHARKRDQRRADVLAFTQKSGV